MKRDLDLIRAILMAVEAQASHDKAVIIKLDDRDPAAVHYHVGLLEQAGLITAMHNYQTHETTSHWLGLNLTWAGHEFLDAARNEDRWKAAKAAATKVGGITFTMFQAILTEGIKRQIWPPG